MNWNYRIRQIHRWTSIVFAALVAAIFVAQGVGREPAEWVYLLPLLPLFVLLPTGLYMFVLPYTMRRRAGRPSGGAWE